MKKTDGFTLTELLAMLVVLAAIMMVAIPNINGIMKQQKTTKYKNDAINMIQTAKTKVAKEGQKLENGECIVYSLDYLNDNGNFDKGPNGGSYDQYESFVIYKRDGSEYKYLARLLENNNDKLVGIDYKDINAIKNDADTTLINKNATPIDLKGSYSPTTTKQKANNIPNCGTIKKYNRTYCIKADDNKYYDIVGREIDENTYKGLCMK